MFFLSIYMKVLPLLPYTFSLHKIFNMLLLTSIKSICYWKKENPFCKMIGRLPSIIIISEGGGGTERETLSNLKIFLSHTLCFPTEDF